MKKIVYAIAVLATLASCSKNDTPAGEIQTTPLVIKEATMSLLETRADFASDVEMAIKLNGAGYNNVKKYIYAFGKYSAPGQISPEATPCWNGKTADDGIMLHVPGTLTAFVPANFDTSKADDCVQLTNQVYDKEKSYNASDNQDICVARDVTVSGTLNTVKLSLKHIFSSFSFKFTKDRSFQCSVGKLEKITMIGTGISHSRKFNVNTFQWGESADQLQLSRSVITPNLDINGNLTNGVTTLDLLINPFKITDANNFYIIFTIDNTNYGLEIPQSKFIECKENNKYLFNIVLQDGRATLSNITTMEWNDFTVPGGKLPLNA